MHANFCRVMRGIRVGILAVILTSFWGGEIWGEEVEYRDICQLLGGRSDREFLGRPGNLYAVVGAKARLIYMADDLSVRSNLWGGKVVEWRPDYVQLAVGEVLGVDGKVATGVVAEKFCWVGLKDSVLTEYVLKNGGVEAQKVRLSFHLQGVEGVKVVNGRVFFKVSGGYPKTLIAELFGVVAGTSAMEIVGDQIRVDLEVPAGQVVRWVGSMAIGVEIGRVEAVAVRSAAGIEDSGPYPKKGEEWRVAKGEGDARGESRGYWNGIFGREIPTFSCSDPFLEKLYYFRWWSLLTKLNIGGYGHWKKPLAREGTVGFNSLISYSGAPSTIDLRWMRSPEWAFGNVESFFENLHDGRLANHIYPDHLDGDKGNNAPGVKGVAIDFPYENFLVKALMETQALHPDKALLRRLWPALKNAVAIYDQELDVDHDGLYETYPWSNITGQEWGARFLYFHPFDRLLFYGRDWRPKNDGEAASVGEMIERSVVLRPGMKVGRTMAEMLPQVEADRHYRQETLDASSYAYVEMKSMGGIAEILGEKEERARWMGAAERTRVEVLAKLWDPSTGFFYDRDGVSKEWSLVKSPTGFYPFWAGIGTKEELAIFKHLFNPKEFWTPYPLPTISMDYPKLGELRKLGWTYWNWNNWPMTTSHVVDATARAAKEMDATMTGGAAEFFRKYTKVHFLGGDLRRPCVSEYFDPITGAANIPTLDYAHSYYIDLVMRHVIGVEVDVLSDVVRIDPLDMGLTHFEVGNIWVRGREMSVRWKDGELIVKVEGKVVASGKKLERLEFRLGARWGGE